jgi:hypothetical protein
MNPDGSAHLLNVCPYVIPPPTQILCSRKYDKNCPLCNHREPSDGCPNDMDAQACGAGALYNHREPSDSCPNDMDAQAEEKHPCEHQCQIEKTTPAKNLERVYKWNCNCLRGASIVDWDRIKVLNNFF